MSKPRSLPARMIFVCTGGSCRAAGSRKLFKALSKLLRDEEGSNVRLQQTRCMGECSHAPNIICYPEACAYRNVKKGDLPYFAGKAPAPREDED